MQNFRTTVVSEKELKERMHTAAKKLGVNVSALLKTAFVSFEAEMRKKGILPENEER